MRAPVEDEMARAAQEIAQWARPEVSADFLPLPEAPPGRVLAVDGSRAVLADTGAVWVAAGRSAVASWPGGMAARWPGEASMSSSVPILPDATSQPARPRPPTRILVSPPEDAPQQVAHAYEAEGLPPPRAATSEAWAEAWSGLAEMQGAIRAVREMPEGALLVVDGALHGLPHVAQAMAGRIADAAREAGCTLVGVAKRSALARDGVPLVPALGRQGPQGRWVCAVGEGVFVARLHPRATACFRIDAPGVEAIARLVPLCRDAGYAGYPYPLAVAHNAAALTVDQAADLRLRLEGQVRAVAGREAFQLLDDFHAVLDRGVPG